MNCDFPGCNKPKVCGYYCANHHRLICVAGISSTLEVKKVENIAVEFSYTFGVSYEICLEKFADLLMSNRKY